MEPGGQGHNYFPPKEEDMMIQKRIFRLFLISLLAFWVALPSKGFCEEQIDANITASLKVAEVNGNPALSSFQRINEPGFSDRLNRYAWSMTVFKDELYAGTWNVHGFYRRNRANGAQVYRYVEGTEWEQVVSNGLGSTDNQGLRTMIVWDDPDDSPDKGSAIYGTTMDEDNGLEVWRTFDGDNWEVVVGRGAPYPNGFDGGRINDSGRGMQLYPSGGKEWLYLGTRGYNGGEIWRTEDGAAWEKVTDAQALGLTGQPLAMADICVFQDDALKPPALFVGTWGTGGFNVIKSYDGINFEVVATDGINNPRNNGVAKLIVFEGKLWLLTINYANGFDIYTSGAGPITGNQNWQLVASNGLTDRRNLYAWNAIVFDNGTGPRLYIGTYNLYHGFYLYSVTSDMTWAVEVGEGSMYPSGLGKISSYGARSFAVFNDRLIIGLACNARPAEVWMAR